MEQDKFEKFTTDQLKKRNKAGFIITMFLLVFGLISIILAIYDYISEKTFNTSFLISTLICFFMAFIIYIGIKSAKNEIARRKDT